MLHRSDKSGQFSPPARAVVGSELRAFFIVLHPGMFLAEHPHPTESIVYTVSGTWVLCSEGKRHVMKPGSLFHFGDDKPTGWEAPFGEDVHLLIVKKKNRPDQDYESYMAGLTRMRDDTLKQRASGVPFWFYELPPDHAARQFATRVNPHFDEVLEASRARAGNTSTRPR